MMRWLDLQTEPQGRAERELRPRADGAVHARRRQLHRGRRKRGRAGVHRLVDRVDGQFAFNRNQHDAGSKTILGQTGNFDGDDVIDDAGAHPATARFISNKLFRFFAYPNPAPERRGPAGRRLSAVQRLDQGRGRGDPALARVLVRAGVSRRSSRARPSSWSGRCGRSALSQVPPQAVPAMRLLGQELFNPPNVAGWFGNRSWINAATLLARFNVLGHGGERSLGRRCSAGQPIANAAPGAGHVGRARAAACSTCS